MEIPFNGPDPMKTILPNFLTHSLSLSLHPGPSYVSASSAHPSTSSTCKGTHAHRASTRGVFLCVL